MLFLIQAKSMQKIRSENFLLLWILTSILMIFILLFWFRNLKQQIVSLKTQYPKSEEVSQIQSLLKNGFQEISTSFNEGIENRPSLLKK